MPVIAVSYCEMEQTLESTNEENCLIQSVMNHNRQGRDGISSLKRLTVMSSA
jgi:hypothetical protein